MNKVPRSPLFAAAVLGLSFSIGLTGALAEEKKKKEEKPDVQIDRSVLKDLEGYAPPPMFGPETGGGIPASDTLSRPFSAPPPAPVLTEPKVEDLLKHPVANTGVLTVPQELLPEKENPLPSSSSSLPVPTGKSPAEKKEKGQKISPITAETKKETDKKTPDPQRKAEQKQPQTETIMASPPKGGPAYKPKTRPTMPAVPAIDVEEKELDPFNLPSPADNKKEGEEEIAPELVTPTPGERLMDQALTSRMVKQDDPAVGKAIETIAKDKSPKDTGDTKTKDKETGKDTRNKKKIPLADLPPALISLEFGANLSDLQTDQKTFLVSDVLPRLQREESLRLQIRSFAHAKGNGESSARRLSLARGLAVRSYLLEKGVSPGRVDVRALGDDTLEKPVDRVDLIFQDSAEE